MKVARMRMIDIGRRRREGGVYDEGGCVRQGWMGLAEGWSSSREVGREVMMEDGSGRHYRGREDGSSAAGGGGKGQVWLVAAVVSALQHLKKVV